MNYQIITANIAEALEELENIKAKITSSKLSEVEFQIALQHVYHHLNFAWNIRGKTTDQYKSMTDDDFAEWGAYPKDLDFEEE